MPRVLLIDSQSHMLALLKSKFELEGFDVVTAAGGDEAIRLAGETGPDLIVLDERVVGSGGRPLRDVLRAALAGREIPLIVLTPRDSRDRSAGQGEAGDTLLPLPFRPSQLLALARESI